MVDLHTQYLKIKDSVDAAISRVLDSTAFINGPDVKEFKKELELYLNISHVIPCANGTDALQAALMALELEPGDEVITTNFTFIATVEAIALLGLTPVLVDVEPDTFNISPESFEKAITDKTKAVIPVHLFGQCADMTRIMEIARKNNLYVIEDTAQAIGADCFFQDNAACKAGTIGDIGCVSFFPSKNLGCYGDGGAIFTNRDDLAEKAGSIVNHGMKQRYYHDRIGINSRLDSLQAAVLRIKLQHLDNYIKARQNAAEYYDNAFREHPVLTIPRRVPYSSHIFHQYTLKTLGIDRMHLKEYLASKGIPSMIYYPVPLHLQKVYNDSRYREGDFPVTEQLCNSVLSLPIHTELDEEQLEFITGNVLAFVNQ